MELDAWLEQGLTGEETKQTYQFYMRPEPRENLGPIEVDDETGMRIRWMNVGMLRGEGPKHRRKVFLDPIPHIRIEKAKDLQGWYKSKIEPPGKRPRPCFTEAMLTEPYGGYCAVGCSFCYINSGFRGYRGSGLVSVPMNYGQQLRDQLSKMKTSAAGYFSSFTDPFLPLEDIYHNTEEGARAFVDNGLPIFFLSRIAYPGWAFDLLTKNKYSYAQKSINTPHEAVWRKLSPGAATLERHMDDIRELKRLGVYVSIQVNPLLPGVITHEDVELLFEMLKQAGTDHVIVKFVEAGYNWAPAMVERTRKRFKDARAETFASLFTQNIGGERTVNEEYRMEGHRRYSSKAKALGLTYATCYEYKYDRTPEGEIVNKTGVSIGREFITADQCHGHRVPMFTRESDGAPFTEVEECPPTGCMYCKDDNGGETLCGSAVLGAATALRKPQLRLGVHDPAARNLLPVLK